MKKRTVVIALVSLVVALVAVSAAWAATQGPAGGRAKTGTPPRGGVALCRALASDPAAQKDMQALRAEHLADMNAWNDQYGQQPSSAEAQAALAKLRTEHRNEMLALMKKYGIATGAANGRGMMGGSGGCGSGSGMMGSGGCGGTGGF